MATKLCKKCDLDRDVEAFARDRSRKDGRHPYCKACQKPSQESYAASHREEARQRANAWHKVNGDRTKAYRANPDVKERRRVYMRDWRQLRAPERREYRSSYERARCASDPVYRLAVNLRKRLGVAIRDGQKAGSAVRDLGCSIPELKSYLESLFQAGMTWDNWSLTGWHIDHVRPLSKFDLADPEQFLQAVHYTNLQPLWAEKNLKKGNRIAV